ncbi:alpha/beta fold hydrolase [Niveispirillum sp.]|uniref:alpha/beta fold hydrolase n=1 Tax=Niveispirillum sp. TaxID=1917217 RepID=UPI001B4D9E34|nr:alpha/beta fold hydrolase [Niveispirillum sp.]MBP7336691.1 alpha/beta fold hydrolase [Niveispirillum sp.]
MAMARGIPVRDTILWVQDTGEVDLPVIFCLHSLWLDGSMFDALVPAAAGRFRFVRPDFRGQGSSAPHTGDVVDMDCCADDMNALIDILGLRSVHLAAASMGGDVAVRMIARRPDLFASLAMLGSSVRAEPPDQLAHFTAWLEGARRTGFVGENLDVLMSIMFGATTRAQADAQPMLRPWRNKLELTPMSRWPALVGVLNRTSAVDLLPSIAVPTLVLSGADDIARPPDWGREVADGVPDGRQIVLEGVGHTPILEAPDTVLPLALRFFADTIAR